MLDKQKQQRRMLPMAEFALMLVEKTLKKVQQLQREINQWPGKQIKR